MPGAFFTASGKKGDHVIKARVRGRDLLLVSGAELSEGAGRSVHCSDYECRGSWGKIRENLIPLHLVCELIFANSFYIPMWKVLPAQVIVSETEISLLLRFTQFSVIGLEWRD